MLTTASLRLIGSRQLQFCDTAKTVHCYLAAANETTACLEGMCVEVQQLFCLRFTMCLKIPTVHIDNFQWACSQCYVSLLT